MNLLGFMDLEAHITHIGNGLFTFQSINSGKETDPTKKKKEKKTLITSEAPWRQGEKRDTENGRMNNNSVNI